MVAPRYCRSYAALTRQVAMYLFARKNDQPGPLPEIAASLWQGAITPRLCTGVKTHRELKPRTTVTYRRKSELCALSRGLKAPACQNTREGLGRAFRFVAENQQKLFVEYIEYRVVFPPGLPEEDGIWKFSSNARVLKAVSTGPISG